jgi:AcrR family transcriptional regulator
MTEDPRAAKSSRRDQILATAAELFAARGFHGVSVAELGAACGVSGPALYKHFASKDAMLSEMLVGISQTLLTEGEKRVADAATPSGALVALIAWHVDFALRDRALIVVQERDWASLPLEARERVRTLQRAYVDLWATQIRLAAGEPEMARDAARARAHAVFGLINSTPHNRVVPDLRMRAILRSMALDALGVPVTEESDATAS